MARSGFKSHPSGDSKSRPAHKPIKVDVNAPIQHRSEPTTADFDQIEAYANDPANATDRPDASEGPTDGHDASEGPSPKTGTEETVTSTQGGATGAGRSGATPQSPPSSNAPASAAPAKPNADSKSTSSGAGSGLGAGMSTPGASSKMSRLATRFLGKRNRTGVQIAVASIVMLMIILGFLAAIPLKLIHIANTLFHHNFKYNEHISKRAEARVLSKLFGMQLDSDGGRRSNTGKWLHDKMVNMRIDKFKDLLAKDGLKMQFDDKGRFLGIVDQSGKLVTDDLRNKGYWEQRQSVGHIVRERLAPHRYLQHALYTKAMRLHAGISFKFWTKRKAGDLKDRLFSKVRYGLAGDSTLAEPGTRERGAPDPNDKAATEEFKKQQEAARNAGDAARAQWDVFNKTKDIAKAHKAGIEAFRNKASLTFGFTGIAMLYCLMQEMVDHALKEGYIERATYLMRAGNMLLTMRDQMYSGELNLEDFGEMMTRFDGNPNADPAAEEDAKDYTQACAWKRAMEEACSTAREDDKYVNYNPDLSEAANPDASALTGVMGAIADAFQFPGTRSVCKVVNSWFGWVLQGVELVVGVLTGGASAAIASGVKGAVLIFVLQTVVPKLLDAATALGITGTENAVGLINNGDAGLNLSAKDYGRMLGDRVGTDSEVTKIAEAIRVEEAAVAKEKGWTYRTFALNNNKSLVSRLVERTPSSPARFVAAIRTTLFAMPKNFATIIFRPKQVLAASAAPDPYGFRAHVTMDEDFDRYDPLEVEVFLTNPIGDTGKTRLQMLGDPTTYTPANGEDPNNQDLMHCFVNGFRPPQETDDICLDLGVLTKNGKDNPKNPGQNEILQKIYCEVHDVCGVRWADDFNKYRIYLKYVFITRGLDGLTTDEDPFAGSGTPVSGGDVAAGEWTWPIDKSQYRGLTNCWRSGSHAGLDIAADSTPALAAHDGTVVRAENSESAGGDAGRYVRIRINKDLYYNYQHMKSISVNQDDVVTAGQQIGVTDNTGFSTGPHLHFGVTVEDTLSSRSNTSTSRDPLDYLPADRSLSPCR